MSHSPSYPSQQLPTEINLRSVNPLIRPEQVLLSAYEESSCNSHRQFICLHQGSEEWVHVAEKLNQVLPRSNSTRLEPGISRSQGKRPNHQAELCTSDSKNCLVIAMRFKLNMHEAARPKHESRNNFSKQSRCPVFTVVT